MVSFISSDLHIYLFSNFEIRALTAIDIPKTSLDKYMDFINIFSSNLEV